jgi:hypothetical protein
MRAREAGDRINSHSYALQISVAPSGLTITMGRKNPGLTPGATLCRPPTAGSLIIQLIMAQASAASSPELLLQFAKSLNDFFLNQVLTFGNNRLAADNHFAHGRARQRKHDAGE